MAGFINDTSTIKNTSYKVVIPFYLYAAISFLVATILLFFSGKDFTQHYFQPHILAVTHTMALGWGTMIILGASYQLVPVLIEAQLFSNALAYASFILAGTGIPLLIYSLYQFQFTWTALIGAICINAAVLTYVINLAISITKSKTENVHATFVFTASLWLFITTLIGLLLVCNFEHTILPEASVHYLSLHAHIGIVGWFLLLIMGVGSRLIPMFLISKYDNPKRLWLIYYLLNISLLTFIIFFFYITQSVYYLIPLIILLAALVLFITYCRKAYQQRIRKKVDEQMKLSLLSVIMVLLPILVLLSLIVCLLFVETNVRLVLVYGFTIFFGWITAIIFGMTFKTLPFIVWNKVYHAKAGNAKTPTPKDLFSETIFKSMGWSYLSGFGLFVTGILAASNIVLQTATVLLLITAVLYNWNVLKLLLHKPLIK